MDKRTGHATKRAKGSIKEAIGMLIGDSAVQAEGAAEKARRSDHDDFAASSPKSKSTPSA